MPSTSVEAYPIPMQFNMKKTYNAPKLTVHGAVTEMTQQTKGLGSDDGVTLVIPGLTPPDGVPIGSI